MEPPADPVAEVPEVNDVVEITEGPSTGTRGAVQRSRGEGAEQEWCIRKGFKEIWTKSVTIVSKAAKPKQSTAAAGELGEGAEVQIAAGPHAGLFGQVVAVSGSGAEMRWRVKVEDDTTLFAVWVDSVKPAAGRRSVKAGTVDAEALAVAVGQGDIVEGSFVEILDGAAAGSFGVVQKVTGETFARRYKVQVEGKGNGTWSEQVRLADKAAALEAPASATTQEGRKKERLARFATLRPADLSAVPWAQAKAVHAADGGSGGVLLVDLGEEAVAIKPQGPSAVNEFLADRIAVGCGVRVAKTRVVRQGHEEHMQIMQALAGILKKDDMAAMKIVGVWILNNDGKIYGEGSLFYGIVEFVPGVPLMGLEAQKQMLAATPEMYVQLGRICALDVLINNMDRVPLPVWQNDGNMGNVMIAGKGTCIVGIDQQVNAIRQGSYRDNYLKKVLHLADEVSPGGDPTDIVASLTAVLHANMGLTLDRAEADHIVTGIREGLLAIGSAAQSGSLKSCLEAATAEATAAFHDGLDHTALSGGNKPPFDEKATADMTAFVAAVAEAIAGKMDTLRGA